MTSTMAERLSALADKYENAGGDYPILCSAIREALAAEAADDMIPIARGTESYRGFPVPEKIYAAMLAASPPNSAEDE